MDISKFLKQTIDLGKSALDSSTQMFGAGVGFVQQSVGSLSLFGSTETSGKYDDQKYDEKHYFLIPFRLVEEGYSIYSMRCIPEGVPPMNDLPKRRVFHLPNEHALETMKQLLVREATANAESTGVDDTAIGSRLNDLADHIDRLDGRVFHGLLLMGGLVALINPVAGAAVAAKALIPSMGMLLSRYGLKYVGDTANAAAVSAKVKSAEKEVLRQFRGSETSSVVNPVLVQLDLALATNEFEFDPLMEFNRESMDFGERDRDRMLQLTCRAVSNSYESTLNDQGTWHDACLGPEDIRWLKLLAQLAEE